jgi:hypothetical protein
MFIFIYIYVVKLIENLINIRGKDFRVYIVFGKKKKYLQKIQVERKIFKQFKNLTIFHSNYSLILQ